MNKDSIIQKVKKCLALGRSSNSHEAALAIERAHALMEKHKITMTDVELAEISGCKADGWKTKGCPGHAAVLVNLVKRAFGCDAVLTTIRDGRYRNHVEFIGFGPNPQIASYVFAVLLRQLERGRREYLKTFSRRWKRENKAKMAANWAEGWAIAVYCKVKDMVLTDDDRERLQLWKQRRFGKLKSSTERATPKCGRRGDDAYFDGHDAGSQVQLHRGMTGSDRQRLER